mmetsp:Transcript_19817/g.57504  ORF Transcript_19817/g.57504 Transcript_19817/m.57504 type:complete len:305 (-) Transcript_19817:65-979(-)
MTTRTDENATALEAARRYLDVAKAAHESSLLAVVRTTACWSGPRMLDSAHAELRKWKQLRADAMQFYAKVERIQDGLHAKTSEPKSGMGKAYKKRNLSQSNCAEDDGGRRRRVKSGTNTNAQTERRSPEAGSLSVGGQEHEPTAEDAQLYLNKIKAVFADRPRVYANFIKVTSDFTSKTIDTAEVIRRVKDLFFGHNDLILGMNIFLPERFKIELIDLKEDECQVDPSQSSFPLSSFPGLQAFPKGVNVPYFNHIPGSYPYFTGVLSYSGWNGQVLEPQLQHGAMPHRPMAEPHKTHLDSHEKL